MAADSELGGCRQYDNYLVITYLAMNCDLVLVLMCTSGFVFRQGHIDVLY